MDQKGLIHLYCGDGKGKTTASVGLAVRCSGCGGKVLFVQFFKDGSSGEIRPLQSLENIQTLHAGTIRGFYSRMTREQQTQAGKDYATLFQEAIRQAADKDLLILDEIISACNYGVVNEKDLISFLETKPEGLEVVLTGQNPSPALTALADYVTRMEKVKHPYEHGIFARKGIEY